MEGVGIIQHFKKYIQKLIKEIITNLDRLRIKIIKLFGDTAFDVYGLINENCLEGLGM
jgi:hypothetical protein